MIFHPVGQGLFHSGEIRTRSLESSQNQSGIFRFIFDCGSGTTGNNLRKTRSVARRSLRSFSSNEIRKKLYAEWFAEANLDNSKIDLLVISHLHEDHINGLKYLKKPICTLVIPWLSLDDRLGLMAQSIQTLTLAPFWIDPVSYLVSIGCNPDTVVFVKGSDDIPRDGDGASFFDEGSIFPENSEGRRGEGREGEEPAPIRAVWRGKLRPLTDEEKQETADNSSIQQLVLDQQGELLLQGAGGYHFKFCMPLFPKNDTSKEEDFRKEVSRILGGKWNFKAAVNVFTKRVGIKALKAAYRAIYDKNRLNETSLMLWHGIDLSTLKDYRVHVRPQSRHCCGLCSRDCEDQCRIYMYPLLRFHDIRHLSTFLTGDQEFKKNQANRNLFTSTFGSHLVRPSVFQVPHHGSDLSHDMSCMSSEESLAVLSYGLRNTYTHPGKDTCIDIQEAGHKLVLVNESSAFNYSFDLTIKQRKSTEEIV